MQINEDRSPSDDSREPVLPFQAPPGEEFRESPSMGLKIAIVVFVLTAAIAIGYGWLQHNFVQQLSAEREDLRASLALAKSQEASLISKVNALSAFQAQEEAVRSRPALSRLQPETVTGEQLTTPTRSASHPRSRASISHRRATSDDPRWKQVQQQLGDQQKQLAEGQKQWAESRDQIAQTQANLDLAKSDLTSNLQSARSELGGDIARNHGELVALEKKGERTYYEFSFEKSKTYHHTGPISVALHKADARHEYCDLELVVNDKEISRKHVNLYESIALYPEGYVQPLELVINHIDKDSIRGYVSEPKYRSTERVASASVPPAAPSPIAPAEPAASSDVKLEHRTEPGTVR